MSEVAPITDNIAAGPGGADSQASATAAIDDAMKVFAGEFKGKCCVVSQVTDAFLHLVIR